MIVISSSSKRDTSINSNLKKEKKPCNQRILKKNVVRDKTIFKTSNLFVIHQMLFRQKILIIIKDVLKQIFKFTKILIMTQTYKDLQVV